MTNKKDPYYIGVLNVTDSSPSTQNGNLFCNYANDFLVATF